MKRVQLLLRINPPQKAKLKSMAKTAGVSMSAVIRNLIDDSVIREMPPLEYHRLIAELHRIGVNLNQIAAAANSTSLINKAEYMKQAAELRCTVLEIRRSVELR